jgi:hypothetical protein
MTLPVVVHQACVGGVSQWCGWRPLLPEFRRAISFEDVSQAMKTGKRRAITLLHRCHRRVKTLARYRIEVAQSGRFSAGGKPTFTSAITGG